MQFISQFKPFLVYAMPLLFVWLSYWAFNYHKHRKSESRRTEALELGLTEPSSLHPVIDPNKCLGCGACVQACPEGDILGLIYGKAELVSPSNCIGHGACKTACPVDAITLVFGSEKRGVDIPVLTREFETTQPGIYIAGELGGMGLIRNAIEQGSQALASVVNHVQAVPGEALDVIIVGAGPAGIAASLAAKKANLNYLTIDQDSLGGTVSHFPRNKIVMTAPVDLPLVGKVKIRETTKEALLEMWESILLEHNLNTEFQCRLEGIQREGSGFRVDTTGGHHFTKAILLCLGRRGTPRKLNVPGEELPKVVYRLIDPVQYRTQHVLVVGGGDSALEAAISISEEKDTQVSISYRSESFSRAKPKNRTGIETAAAANRIKILLSSNVKSIEMEKVVIEQQDKIFEIRNDAVIVCAGGILPTPFLNEIGIGVETKYGAS